MSTTKFIFQIETEPHYQVLIRILVRFSRHRVPIEELQTLQNAPALQRIVVTVYETKENALKISKKIAGEIEVHSVKLFEEAI